MGDPATIHPALSAAAPESGGSANASADADADADIALMNAFAQGDAKAFDQLYARHQAGLYRFIRRLLGRDLQAQLDEVFQDTWLRVIQSRERWSPQGASFRTWLFTLAHHRVVDQLRKSGREVELPDDGDGAPFTPAGVAWSAWPAAGATPTADDQLFWRRAGERLLTCLDELPIAQRVAFLLHHEEGLSVQDLARVIGLNAETAKSRLRYAMTKLRVCMGAYLPPSWNPAPAGGS